MKTSPPELSALLLISLSLLLSVNAFAGRRIEKREEATNVLTGTVKTVQATTKERSIDYVVQVTVESVEKGLGIKTGDTVPVNCYMSNDEFYKNKSKQELAKLGPGIGPSSYRGVPKEGERIKVYALKGVDKKYYGIFPDWYDVVQ